MSRIQKGGSPPGKSILRLALTVGLAALVLGLVALAGPAPDTLLGAPCLNCGDTTGTTTGTTYRTLTVTVSGPGTVAESPLSCTSDISPCEWKYPNLETAQPAADPDSGYSFTGWSGACSGTGACSITMNANKSVTASFADTTPPPPPTISSPSAGQTFAPSSGSPSASISFSRADGGGATGTSGFRCQVDNSTPPGTPCTSPWSTGALSTGAHTVYVWALDPAGNFSGFTARSFKAVRRPDTTISGTPAEGALVNSAGTAFAYESDIGGASFQCALDGTFVPCNANVAPGEGAHTLSVQAGTSPLGDGNTYLDTTPAVRSWTVDTQPPDTSIDSGPPQQTGATSAELAFSGVDPSPGTAIHYECRLDEGEYRPCTSPVTYSGLAAGTHTASIHAVDAAGNVDPSPASHTWQVLAAATGGGPTGTQVAGPTKPPGEAPGKVGSIKWRSHGSRTELRVLTVTELASGSRLTLTCKGAGCPFKHRKARISGSTAQLAGAFHHRPLRQGTRIELRITAPQWTARIIRITIRAHRKPLIAGG